MSPARLLRRWCVASAAFALGAPGAQAATPPPLYVTYDANGTLSVSVSGGAVLSSSNAIPPGPYWVTFDNEFSAERIVHKWHLLGPGVDVSTVGADLNCDSSIEQYIGVLQPSSTYTVRTTSIRLSGRWSFARPPPDRVRPGSPQPRPR